MGSCWTFRRWAPDNEYDFESKQIADNVMSINNAELLKKYIYDLFLRKFGDLVNTKAKNLYECESVANLILIGIKILINKDMNLHVFFF
jgi:hypothetical protein